MDCTKCHLPKELAKGKRWCKDCKNEYEHIRRQNKDVKDETNKRSREQYHAKKETITVQKIDTNQLKQCSVCKETRTLDNFHQAKCKGTIRAMCKVCSTEKRKEYYVNNKKALNTQVTKYQIQRMKTDPAFKMERYMRARIYSAFKDQGQLKAKRTWKYLDCSSDFFQEWLQSQLYDGMTLDNYGKVWHIDHVIPCASFNLADEESIKKCFCWKNLRPLLIHKNRTKLAKINIIEILLQELKVKVFLKSRVLKL